MYRKTPLSTPRSFSALLRTFGRDENGLALTEFALVLPFLVAAFLGLSTIVDTQIVTTKVGRVTATVGDIVAQGSTANPAIVQAAFMAAPAILGPQLGGQIDLFVAGVDIDEDGRATVAWVETNKPGVAKPTVGSSYQLPATLRTAAAEGFVVATRGVLNHSPMFGDRLAGDQTYQYENFFVPRSSDRVEWKPN